MTSHATVSAEKSKVLSQITKDDLRELTDVIDDIAQAKDLLHAICQLVGDHIDGPIGNHLVSIAHAAGEKLDAVSSLIAAWPSAGHVTIAE